MVGERNSSSPPCPVAFRIHPLTHNNLQRFGLTDQLRAGRWLLMEPLPYFDMLGLMSESRLVITDSGGVQEESTVLGVPCLTVRENTERPVTVTQGSNQLIGTRPEAIWAAFEALRLSGQTPGKTGEPARRPELWDGQAARRIAAEIWSRRKKFLSE